MQTQLKIEFHGASGSDAWRQNIKKHVEDLDRMYGRMTSCHVSLEPPGSAQRKGGLFHVRVHISLPDGRKVNVGITPSEDNRHADVPFALGDAFRRAQAAAAAGPRQAERLCSSNRFCRIWSCWKRLSCKTDS